MQWDGSGWIEVGDGTLGADPDSGDSAPSIAIGPDDHPIVAWDSVNAGEVSSTVVVKQWDGAAWNQLGDLGGGVGSSRDRSPSVAFTRGGADCFVSYREHASTDGEGTADYDLHVERWDGATWSDVGPVIDDSELYNVEATSIVVPASGRPMVAYAHQALAARRSRSAAGPGRRGFRSRTR